MILTIKNQAVGTRSYLGGLVTVAESSQTIVPRDFNVAISQDATFIFDCTSERIILNNGATDLSGGSALDLVKILSQFVLDPIAMMPIYYRAPVNLSHSGNTAADSTVWTMRNDPTSLFQIVIERIRLKIAFDEATPLGRQTLAYDLRRFSTATPTGGAAITAILNDTLAGATTVTDIRSSPTGLTTTSMVFENPFIVVQIPAVSGAVDNYANDKEAFKLAPGQGLAIRLNAAAINGQSLCGEIVWSAR